MSRRNSAPGSNALRASCESNGLRPLRYSIDVAVDGCRDVRLDDHGRVVPAHPLHSTARRGGRRGQVNPLDPGDVRVRSEPGTGHLRTTSAWEGGLASSHSPSPYFRVTFTEGGQVVSARRAWSAESHPVLLRDHALCAPYLSCSGLPIPVQGCRKQASMGMSIRLRVLRFVFCQCR